MAGECCVGWVRGVTALCLIGAISFVVLSCVKSRASAGRLFASLHTWARQRSLVYCRVQCQLVRCLYSLSRALACSSSSLRAGGVGVWGCDSRGGVHRVCVPEQGVWSGRELTLVHLRVVDASQPAGVCDSE
jgi:hypothetical protein